MGTRLPDQWEKHDDSESGYGLEALGNMTRWDWAQDLFEWFEYYLQGRGTQPEQFAQIQRSDGQWRIEDTWPPVTPRTMWWILAIVEMTDPLPEDFP